MADMSQKSLIEDLKASINQASEYFKASANADFIRLLDAAAADMSRIRMLVLKESITLIAGQTEYAAPANIKRVTRTTWGREARKTRKPWNSNYPQQLPFLELIETGTSAMLDLSRSVNASEISDIGSACGYFYEAAHSINTDAANTTIKPADRPLLIMRAQVEACRELAFRQIGKPVSLRTGVGGQAKNGTPAALSDSLMSSWLEQGRRLAS